MQKTKLVTGIEAIQSGKPFRWVNSPDKHDPDPLSALEEMLKKLVF